MKQNTHWAAQVLNSIGAKLSAKVLRSEVRTSYWACRSSASTMVSRVVPSSSPR